MNDDAMLVEFIRYDVWANQTLLKTCELLSPEQLVAGAPGTYGTIYRTLEHLVDSEAHYYSLLAGEPLPAPFKWADRPPVADIRAYYGAVGEAVVQAAGRVRPDDVVHQHWQAGPVTYKALTVLIQIVNHGVEHRTNITTIISALGLPAPDLDGWSYLSANWDRLGL